MALVEYGYSGISNWDNAPPSHACDCADRLVVLSEKVLDLPIKNWGKWENARTSVPHIGIHDFVRKIETHRALTTEEIDLLAEFLAKDNCPGWTGVIIVESGRFVYACRTTWDSSD